MKSDYVWMVKKRGVSIWFEYSREDARKICDYFNGFAKGKKDAPYKVKQYREVGK